MRRTSPLTCCCTALPVPRALGLRCTWWGDTCYPSSACTTQVVAANLRCRLQQLHQHLGDAAASRRMVHTLLDLATAVEQPAAKLQLLRMALAANRRDDALLEEPVSIVPAVHAYLDQGMASMVRGG